MDIAFKTAIFCSFVLNIFSLYIFTMGKTYVDNALNRRLGRVGKPLGSMPQSSSVSDANVHVDNAQNRQPGRVGQPYGSAAASEARGPPKKTNARSTNTSTTRVNVDNSDNRSLRGASQPLGMSRISEQSEHSADTHSRTSRSSSTVPKEVLKSDDKSTRDTKVYVDNATNRRLGRVGLPHGTAVVSKEGRNLSPVHSQRNISSNLSTGSVVRNTNNARGVDFSATIQKTVLTSDDGLTNSCNVYVDNTMTKQVSRVDQAHGIAKESEYLVHSTDTNARVNTPLTTHRQVLTSGNKSTKSTRVCGNSPTKTHLGHESQSFGIARVSKARSASSSDELLDEEKHSHSKSNMSDLSLTFNSLYKEPSRKSKKKTSADGNFIEAAMNEYNQVSSHRVYVDNAQNRKLGRVGLPIGTKVFSSKTKDVTTRLYANTPLNRQLGRVGMPQGSMPRRSVATDKIPEMIEKLIKKGVSINVFCHGISSI